MKKYKQYLNEYILDLRSLIELSSFSLIVLSLIILPISKVHRLDIALSVSLIFYYVFIRPNIKDTQTFYVFRLIASNATRRAILHFVLIRLIIKRSLDIYSNYYFIKYTLIMTIVFILYLLIVAYISNNKIKKREKYFKDFKYNDRLIIDSYLSQTYPLEKLESFKYYSHLSSLYSDDNTSSEDLELKYAYLKELFSKKEDDENKEKIRLEILKKLEEAYQFIKFENK